MLIKEVIDGIGLVKEVIENVVVIVQAVSDGKEYLRQNHPQARKDVEAMLLELRKNEVLIAEVSGVVTRFRFDAGVAGSALQRFNDYYIQQGGKAAALRQQIDNLRTRCATVRQHAGNVSGGVGRSAFQRFFEMVNVEPALRRAELGETLDRLANEDLASARAAYVILNCVELALKDVQAALETNGVMDVANVPAAAALLKEYASAFRDLEALAQATGKRITELAGELADDA